MAVLVIAPREETQDIRLTRLVDFREQDPAEWEELLRHASRREGGEAHHSIVLRDQVLGPDPWTYRRYSKDYRETKDAHDRHANQEVSFPFQRIETFDGTAILASNRRELRIPPG